MATVTLDLNRFKSSGVYTVEFDASERIITNTNTIRLIVGFSRKGPFNTPVFLRDAGTAKRVFGDVDPMLERRGSFFHRSLFSALEIGPVYALNLLSVNNAPISEGGDAAEYFSYSISTGETNGIKAKSLYSSFYDTDRFWKLDADNLVAIAGANTSNNGKLFNIVNVSQTPVTVLIRKAVGLKGYDITAREWYLSRNEPIPAFVKEWDYISDYFVDAHVVQGNWSDYASLSKDPVYSKYFNNRGLIKSTYSEFLSSPEVVKIASFVGCMIPNFVDGNNANQSIDVIMNNAVATTGVYVAFNNEALEDYEASTSTVDLIGHYLADEIAQPDAIDMLSYKRSLKSQYTYTTKDTFTTTAYTQNNSGEFGFQNRLLTGKNGRFENVVSLLKPSSSQLTGFTLAKYNEIKANLHVKGSLIDLVTADKYGIVESFGERTVQDGSTLYTYLDIAYSHPDKADEADVTTHTISSVVSTTGAMALVLIGYHDTDPDIAVGKPILIQNPTTPGSYFYVTVKTAPEKYTGSSGVQGPSGLDTTYVEVEDSAALAAMASVPQNYVASWGATELADLSGGTVTFVYEPDIFTYNTDESSRKFIVYPYSQVYKDYESNLLADGDKYYHSTADFYYTKYTKTQDDDEIPVIYMRAYTDADLNSVVTGTAFNVTDNWVIGAGSANVAGRIDIYSDSVTVLSDITPLSWDITKTRITLDEVEGTKAQVGEYLVCLTFDEDNQEVYSMTKVLTKVRKVNTSTGVITYEVTTNQPVYIENELTPSSTKYIKHFISIESLVNEYQLVSLSGFKLTSYHLPGDNTNKESQLERIYGVLEPENSGLFNALKDKDTIQFRYIVDTFNGGLQPQMGPKNVLSRLAKARQKCLAFINPPSFKEFANSTDPRFTDAPDPANGKPRPILNTEYIAEGGNTSLGPTFLWSLPDELNGSKYAGFFWPHLVIREGSKNIIVPPAAHASNLFVQKFISGYPYAIIAGTRRGVISDRFLVGVEAPLYQEDRDALEPMGMNPIIRKEGVGEAVIYGNQTAFQKTLSALNNLHVRDLLITIEEQIEQTLEGYTFEFNNAETRLEIKNRISAYLDGVRTASGIYEYRVIMDETNNTNDIINQNFGIVDVQVEPQRGMQKIINRVTVFNTGQISSGGFTLA